MCNLDETAVSGMCFPRPGEDMEKPSGSRGLAVHPAPLRPVHSTGGLFHCPEAASLPLSFGHTLWLPQQRELNNQTNTAKLKQDLQGPIWFSGSLAEMKKLWHKSKLGQMEKGNRSGCMSHCLLGSSGSLVGTGM